MKCEQTTLLWVSPTISNTGWVTYDFDYTPTQLYKYLILEASCTSAVGDKPYNGNILVDHIVIKDPVVIEDPDDPGSVPDNTIIASEVCKLAVPNVFTPNADEWNEMFEVHYNSNVARFNLSIYNRWGTLVFESSDITHAWDGRTENGNEAGTGMYYWVINCLCIENNTILDDNLKGTVSVIR
jgi:gliding motility-associated-like protein